MTPVVSGTITVQIVRDKHIPMTPLERVVGFRVSEDIYDHLTLVDQLIIDLLIEGWEQQDIAHLFCVHKSWISIRLKRIRAYMASTELYRIVKIRQEMKDGEQI